MQVSVLKSLLKKLEQSEKTLLRAAGLHPTKNRTRNLINYYELFSDEECDLIIELLSNNGHDNMHLGVLPFVNRNYLLDVIHANMKRSPSHSYTGHRSDMIIVDDIDTNVVRTVFEKKQTWERMKNWLKKENLTPTGRYRRG